MKKIMGILTVLLAVLTLTACSATKAAQTGMYLQKAVLSAEEQSILDLVGSDGVPYILDFVVDDTVQALQINTYELQDGAWRLMSGGGGWQLRDALGRISFTFENIGLGMRTGVQSEHQGGSTSHTTEPDFSFEGMDTATSYHTDPTAIVYEEEIPLVIQIHTTKNEIRSSSPDHGFDQPQTYADAGYEKVYAITCMFSQKTVNELSEGGNRAGPAA